MPSNAILYSCETWIAKGITEVQIQYMSSIQDLLGVRRQSPSNMIYVELEIPSVHTLIRRIQIIDFSSSSNNCEGSPLQKGYSNGKEFPIPYGAVYQRLLWGSISKA